MKPSLLLLAALGAGILSACARLAPASDDEVLGKRDFVLEQDISDAPKGSPRVLYNVRVQNDSLKMAARFRGGCVRPEFTLFVTRKSAEELVAYVSLDTRGDTCKGTVDNHPVAFSLKYARSDLKLDPVFSIISRFGEPDPFNVQAR